jgi:hypothetical protein
MSAVTDTSVNHNFLSPLNFKFTIKKAPTVNFFIQETVIPGLSVDATSQPNPMVRIPLSGEHIRYEDYEFSFKVDEDLENWLEIYNWLIGDGKLTFEGYKVLQDKPIYSGEGLKSDISIITLSGTKMPNMEIVLHDAFPVRLSSIKFTTTDSDVDYITASSTFKYTYYDIRKLII